jgi:tetratricopeptide (TPR) repeat protein
MPVESRREQRTALTAALRADGWTWEDVAQEFREHERCTPLLALRWAHGKSQQMTADAYNALLTADPNDRPVNFRTIHRWEQWPHGGTEPPLAALNRLARVYQVRAAFLFDAEDYRHLDEAYQPRPGGDPVREELLPSRRPAIEPSGARPPGAHPDGRHHDEFEAPPLVLVLHGRNPMERRAVLAAIASLPGVALLPIPGGGQGLLDPGAHDVIDRAIQRPESVGPEILEPLDTLIMGFRHLDDTLGGRYVTGPVDGILRLFGDLLPAAQPRIRQPLFSLAAGAAQLAGWLALDRGDHAEARRMYAQALDWATAADDPALSAYVWGCRAEQAWILRDAIDAVSTAEAARRVAARQDKTLRAWVETKAGRAYALAGNVDETIRAMGQATSLLAGAETDGAPGWLYHFHAENLAASHGSALTLVGEAERSTRMLDEALGQLPPTYARERGILLVYQADALRVVGDVERACAVGTEAGHIGRQTASRRTVELVVQLHRSLEARAASHPDVRTLGDLLHEGGYGPAGNG